MHKMQTSTQAGRCKNIEYLLLKIRQNLIIPKKKQFGFRHAKKDNDSVFLCWYVFQGTYLNIASFLYTW